MYAIFYSHRSFCARLYLFNELSSVMDSGVDAGPLISSSGKYFATDSDHDGQTHVHVYCTVTVSNPARLLLRGSRLQCIS
jgi:hypothetical protein